MAVRADAFHHLLFTIYDLPAFMLISYNWLRELTSTRLTPLELRERLTMVGLAIDAVDEIQGDSVLDVEVPSNRPDCLSHIGIAREVAVIEKSKVQSPTSKVCATEGRATDFTAVEINDEDLCPRYAARIVRGVKIAPSPDWLAKRLGEIGQRPINNVADITNYVLHELGQPLHAFDLAKLTEQRIVVRRARSGEKLATLDDVERTLAPEMLVIADAIRPVALAGIMGGLDSEISATTTDVLIESAYFSPDSVRRTARQLGMDTEASRRFERGADCENVLRAQTRCVELICEIAGGVASEDAIDVYPNPFPERRVRFRPSRVESLTSVRVELPEMTRILIALGFVPSEARENTVLSFVVPSWRIDVGLEEDLVEEVVRHVGYDRIASELPASSLAGEYQPAEMKRRELRKAFTSLGFDEAINFSFIDVAHDEQFEVLPAFHLSRQWENESGAAVTLSNPILDEAIRMRPTLLPGLLESVRHNLNHGNRDVRLFEIGRVFANSETSALSDKLPNEREALGLIATGGANEEGYAQATRDTDFFELKGALEAAIDAMSLAPLIFSEANVKHLREGQAARVTLADGFPIGSIGRLAESIATAYKFRQPVYVAELDLTTLLDSRERSIQYSPLPRYPAVMRDVTLLVGREVAFAQLVQVIDSETIPNYAGTKLVGIYEGANIPSDKRSITLRMEYRSDEGTLRDEEVEERHRELIDSLVAKFSAQLH
ncbi:MAG TPA: phenylalanine--tRNA ligase subunit beta [Pyrinomonadaceae bacterium]|nr:phenylalanine--tRNA ligase subunit beta [Pyrinomonadaceae bacterium]